MYGKFALDNKYYEDAIFAFNKLIEIEPNNVDGYFNLGNAYHLAGKFEAAITAYEHAHAMVPQDIRYIVNLGETYFKLKNPSKAVTYFERVDLKQAPHIAMRIADCYLQLGNIDKSRNALETLIAMPVQQALKDTAKLALNNLNTKRSLT